MSATDSDNSIDWLASDNEDNESEQEPDCTRKHCQTEASSSPSTPPHLGQSDSSCRQSSEVKEGDRNWSEVREASSRGSPSSRTEKSGIELCKTGENMTGRNTQRTLKRHHSFQGEEERTERQLILSVSEKDRTFARKVSPSTTPVCSPQDVVDGVRDTGWHSKDDPPL